MIAYGCGTTDCVLNQLLLFDDYTIGEIYLVGTLATINDSRGRLYYLWLSKLIWCTG